MKAQAEKYKNMWSNSVPGIEAHHKLEIVPSPAKILAFSAIWLGLRETWLG